MVYLHEELANKEEEVVRLQQQLVSLDTAPSPYTLSQDLLQAKVTPCNLEPLFLSLQASPVNDRPGYIMLA